MQSGWNPKEGTFDVVKTKKGLTTFDNTRPAIAQEFDFDYVTVRKHSLTEPLPKGFVKDRGLLVQAEKLKLPEPKTWGDALKIRTMRNKLPLEGTTTRPRMPR